MGIDVSGGMFVGAHYDDIYFDEDNEEGLDFYEWIEEHELSTFHPNYDAPSEYCHFGFSIDDVEVSEMDEEWFASIKALADKFKEITGADAWLIGMQDIT